MSATKYEINDLNEINRCMKLGGDELIRFYRLFRNLADAESARACRRSLARKAGAAE